MATQEAALDVMAARRKRAYLGGTVSPAVARGRQPRLVEPHRLKCMKTDRFAGSPAFRVLRTVRAYERTARPLVHRRGPRAFPSLAQRRQGYTVGNLLHRSMKQTGHTPMAISLTDATKLGCDRVLHRAVGRQATNRKAPQAIYHALLAARMQDLPGLVPIRRRSTPS